jgi:hypothetical protein
MMRRSFLALLVVAALAGCKINSINYFPPHPATVRVLNLLPGAGPVDVQVAGNAAFGGVAFQALTGYQSFDNRVTNFTVSLTGTGTAIASTSFPLGGDQPYTLLVFGSPSSPQVTLLQEVPSAPTNGSIQFAVFNASYNAGSVDIYVNAPGTDITTVGPNFGSVSFGGTTFNLAFSPGTYQIKVTLAGTKTVIYDSGGTALTPNIALTFIMYGAGSGSLINAVVLQSQGAMATLNTIFARLKAFNAAPGTPSVNQLLGTRPYNSNVLYPSASQYATVPSGATTINFEATTTPGATIASVAATLGPATDVTAVVAGLPGAQQAFYLTDANLPPAFNNSALRFVNASAGSNAVNVAVSGTQVASNVAFAKASAYVQGTAGTVSITFTDAVTGNVVAALQSVTLVAGQTSSVYLVGTQGSQSLVVTQDN